MPEFRTLSGSELVLEGLEETVLELDRVSMAPVLAEGGMHYSDTVRRQTLANGIYIFALDDAGELVAYLQYARDCNHNDDIFIISLQVHPSHRNTMLFGLLLLRACRDMPAQPIRFVNSQVQVHNTRAIRLYRRLGFEITPISRSETTLAVRGSATVITCTIASRFKRRSS